MVIYYPLSCHNCVTTYFWPSQWIERHSPHLCIPSIVLQWKSCIIRNAIALAFLTRRDYVDCARWLWRMRSTSSSYAPLTRIWYACSCYSWVTLWGIGHLIVICLSLHSNCCMPLLVMTGWGHIWESTSVMYSQSWRQCCSGSLAWKLPHQTILDHLHIYALTMLCSPSSSHPTSCLVRRWPVCIPVV